MTGDPSTPLPCDDALHGLQALRAELVEFMKGHLANVDRRIASLESCRRSQRCLADSAPPEAGK